MLAILPGVNASSGILLIVGVWISAALAVTYLLLTRRIKSDTAKWLAITASLLVGMWLYHTPYRHAAKRWWEGGLQVSIACAHSRECVSWLKTAQPDGSGIYPGQQIYAHVCERDDLKALFGSALPCTAGQQ